MNFQPGLKEKNLFPESEMNSRKYPVQNYVPYNPNKTTTKNRTFNDLDLTLKQMTFDEIVNDSDYHFENCFATNLT